MRKCSSFGLHQVQVALPSGMQILIPEWMLDEDRCHGMEIVERPGLAITETTHCATGRCRAEAFQNRQAR